MNRRSRHGATARQELANRSSFCLEALSEIRHYNENLLRDKNGKKNGNNNNLARFILDLYTVEDNYILLVLIVKIIIIMMIMIIIILNYNYSNKRVFKIRHLRLFTVVSIRNPPSLVKGIYRVFQKFVSILYSLKFH